MPVPLEQPPDDEDLSDLFAGVGLPNTASSHPGAGDADGSGVQSSGALIEEHPSGQPVSENTVNGQADENLLAPVNHDGVRMSEGGSGKGGTAEQRPAYSPNSGPGGGLGPVGPIDFAAKEARQRAIGKRGEEVVFEAEKRRVRDSGQDADRVRWTSSTHEVAPFDIESIDENGHTIFIEVKATVGDDPYEGFQISSGELLLGLQKGSRYFIYRVTRAHQAAPEIVRFADPAQLLRSGAAELQMSGATMRFSRP